MIVHLIKEKSLENASQVETANLNKGDTFLKKAEYALFAKNSKIGSIVLKVGKNAIDADMQILGASYLCKNLFPFKSIKEPPKEPGKLIAREEAPKPVNPQIYDKMQNLVGTSNIYTYGKQYSLGTPRLDLQFQGSLYSNYLIGMGKKGLYFSLYKDSNLIAIASKIDMSKNDNHTYTIYIKDDNYLNVAIIATWIFHVTKYENALTTGIIYKVNNYFTPEPIIRQKFNYNFIKEVIEKEGIDNLPENMPIIQAIVKRNKKKEHLKVTILLFVLAIIGLILFLMFKQNAII